MILDVGLKINLDKKRIDKIILLISFKIKESKRSFHMMA